ncbi:MAG TPA: acyltransferase, partial [Janthinobacterium sp.]|nr:acyltransferase [Janthinobacterium sp.]
MSSQKEFYLPSLDGIRAFAVMVVFVSHAGWGHIVPGGFGVTVFFFLSGYLITTLLRTEYEKLGSISFKSFYLRRVYRILPPVYLVLFLIYLLVQIGILTGNVSLVGLMAQVCQVTNYYLLYAQEAGVVPYTGTFWSLAVEEHFYLIFPIFFLFCVSRWPYPKVARIFLAIC